MKDQNLVFNLDTIIVVTQSSYVPSDKINTSSVIIQNPGNVKCMLQDEWTMVPGHVFRVRVDDWNRFQQGLKFTFVGGSLDPDNATAIRRIEIATLDQNPC